MIPLLYSAVVLGQTAQATLMKLNSKTGKSDVVRFNLFKSFAAMLLFLVLFLLLREDFHLPTMLYGMLFGVCISVSSYFAYRALAVGPLSLTYMLMNCCIVISCLYGVLFSDERITLFGAFGFLLMAAAMLLLNFDFSQKKNAGAVGGSRSRVSLKWAILIALTLLGDGFCQVSQSAHQKAFPKQYQIGFMFFAMLTWFTIYFVGSLCTGRIRIARKYLRSDVLAASSGVANSFANYCILMLAAMSAATLLFPTISVVCMLGALLTGFLVFREKLKLQQWLGFFLGVGAVFLLQL